MTRLLKLGNITCNYLLSNYRSLLTFVIILFNDIHVDTLYTMWKKTNISILIKIVGTYEYFETIKQMLIIKEQFNEGENGVDVPSTSNESTDDDEWKDSKRVSTTKKEKWCLERIPSLAVQFYLWSSYKAIITTNFL